MSNILLTAAEQYHFQMIEDLNKPREDGIKVGLQTRLHSGQIEVLKPLFTPGSTTDILMVPCGRKFGKTELAVYALWKFALENPGSACYYICPEASHGRKIVWDLQRIQKFMGKDTAKYVDTCRNQEMMCRLKNGSFIQVVGSDNWSAANGLTPSFVVYDEFKVFHPNWHTEFSPNRAAKAAPLMCIGTLPKVGDKNKDQYESLLEQAETDEGSAVFYKTTFDNPINHMKDQKRVINAEIKRLRDRGEEDVVQREYYSKIVPGGASAVFPMLSKDKHVLSHHLIYDEIRKDIKKMEWYLIADPGSTTCFGVLFAALNPYTRQMYILDEIYEKNQLKTSTRNIIPLMMSKAKALNPYGDLNDDWLKGYDEAGAWFATEAIVQYDLGFMKTEKFKGDKQDGLGLIKDQLIHDKVVISDRCTNLFKEMQEYAKDSKGNIPKKNDHLIDCFRYLNAFAGYTFEGIIEVLKRKPDDIKSRFRRFEDEDDLDEDWTNKMTEEW